MLFYDEDTRVAASGKLDAVGNYSHLKDLGDIGSWNLIRPIGCGILFFYNNQTGAAATGRLNSDGSFTHLKDLTATQPGKSWHAVPVDGGRILFTSANGAAKIAKVDATGSYTDVKDFPVGTFASWSDIITLDGGMMFLYDVDWTNESAPTKAASGRITPAGDYIHLKDFPQGQFGRWNRVNSLAGRWLVFHRFTGETGRLSSSGNYTRAKENIPITVENQWSNIVPVDGYHLFFYQHGNPTHAASGRIDSSGDIKTTNLGSAFGDNWTIIVGSTARPFYT